jgi:hypothetical protein
MKYRDSNLNTASNGNTNDNSNGNTIGHLRYERNSMMCPISYLISLPKPITVSNRKYEYFYSWEGAVDSK